MRNEAYTRKVLPFLLEEYFVDGNDRTLFKEIKSFILKYNNLPTYDALVIEIDSLRNIKEEQVKTITDTLKELSEDKPDIIASVNCERHGRSYTSNYIYCGLIRRPPPIRYPFKK